MSTTSCIALENRNKALRKYKPNPSIESYVEFRRQRAPARKIFREYKKNCFRAFCESITCYIPISSVWRTVRKCSNTFSPKRVCSSLSGYIARDILAAQIQPILFYELPIAQFNILKSEPFSRIQLNQERTMLRVMIISTTP